MENTLFDRFNCPAEVRAILSELPQTAEALPELAEKTGVPLPSVQAAWVIGQMPGLKRLYEEKYENADVLWAGLLADFDSKLRECRGKTGLWGILPLNWYERFFNEITFALGRLQFEKHLWDLPDVPPHVREGDPIAKCHIPSSGPMTPESVLDSLRQAYRFFGCTGNMVVQCKSWLLYPEHVALFPEGSNLRYFGELWRIVGSRKIGGRDLWRIFGKPFTGDWATMPRETTLQRIFADWLAAGNEMGTGFGYLLFDGEKIV